MMIEPVTITDWFEIVFIHYLFHNYSFANYQNKISFPLITFTIDPAFGWFEIVKVTKQSATSIQDLFHKTWLACYPQPQFIVFENGRKSEFEREFKQMFENYDIKAKPATCYNIPSTSKCNH
jgi:hypothetical protein